MRVLVAPQTDRSHAVGAYRLYWPADALIAQGADVTICDPDGSGDADARDFDVLVIQRPRRRIDHVVMRTLQHMGIAVVVDIDDDLHALHPHNAARFGPVLDDPDFGPGWVAKCCRDADLVTVSTPALAERYAKHGRVRVLPNCIPEWYLSVEREPHDGVRVGWAGSLNVHPTDLQATGGGVAQAIRDTGARFHVVGTGKGVKDALGLDDEPTSEGAWLPLDEYPRALAGLDVGIVPLAPGRFNEAKSWLKGLEYASVGVPFVASNTEPYFALRVEGAGHIARPSAQGWCTAVRTMIEDSEIRTMVADRGREAARRFTIEGNAWRWAEAWADALTNRRQGVAA